jgi:hypothetical protein
VGALRTFKTLISYHTLMILLRTQILFTLVLLACCMAPASALFDLHDVQVIPPDAALPPGTLVNLTAIIKPIPPDSFQTFISWNTLNLSTELAEPRWNVVTLADERQVPVTRIYGNVVMIEGTLLSYPVGTNVSVSVQLDGQVPVPAVNQSLTLLRVEEMDQGKVVGPEQVVTVLIAPATVPEVSPAQTETSHEPATPPTKAGLTFVSVLSGVFAAFAVLGRQKT